MQPHKLCVLATHVCDGHAGLCGTLRNSLLTQTSSHCIALDFVPLGVGSTTRLKQNFYPDQQLALDTMR